MDFDKKYHTGMTTSVSLYKGDKGMNFYKVISFNTQEDLKKEILSSLSFFQEPKHPWWEDTDVSKIKILSSDIKGNDVFKLMEDIDSGEIDLNAFSLTVKDNV